MGAAAQPRRRRTLALEAVLHRHGGRPGIRHVLRDAERRDAPRALVAQHIVLGLDGLDPADPRRDHAPDPQGVVGQLGLPPGIRDGLGRGDERELGEAIQAPGLLDREVVGRLEVACTRRPVGDPAVACGPPLVQGGGAQSRGA